MLEGTSIQMSNPIKQEQIYFTDSDYKAWVADHNYIYTKIAQHFGLKFSYKRMMKDTVFRTQPIVYELNSVAFSTNKPPAKSAKPIEQLRDDLLTVSSSVLSTCDEICDCAYILFFNLAQITPTSAIQQINDRIKLTFSALNKNNLDESETKLILLRDDALKAIPINMVNDAYRDLKTAGLNLCAKRDAYNEIKLVTGLSNILEVKEAGKLIANATFLNNRNTITELSTQYNAIITASYATLVRETNKLS
jgi:hypothetical protein